MNRHKPTNHKLKTIPRRFLSAGMAAVFLLSSVLMPTPGWAKEERAAVFSLPQPGTILSISETFAPAILRGLTIHPDNPLQFDFIIDTGDRDLKGASFEAESQRLIKYFLAALTVPEDELWVNLSPYENNRIIPEGLGVTEMGKDMLSQDYLLKQLTASLMYPEEELGQAFWSKVYKKAYELYGTTNIPVNTFNKVWIVPDKAVVYEHAGSAFVVERHLKVMLEEDYLALEHNLQSKDLGLHKQSKGQAKELNELSSKIVKDIILPAIEKEVNEGQTFANLRQIYNSMILATWYKKNLRDSLLGQVYMDRNRVKGIDVEDREIKEKIYQQYLDAFKQGVYNYIREDYDEATQQVIPRKYFSGGLGVGVVTVDKLEVLRGQPGRLPGRVSSAITQPESEKGKNRRVRVALVENAGRNVFSKPGRLKRALTILLSALGVFSSGPDALPQNAVQDFQSQLFHTTQIVRMKYTDQEKEINDLIQGIKGENWLQDLVLLRRLEEIGEPAVSQLRKLLSPWFNERFEREKAIYLLGRIRPVRQDILEEMFEYLEISQLFTWRNVVTPLLHVIEDIGPEAEMAVPQLVDLYDSYATPNLVLVYDPSDALVAIGEASVPSLMAYLDKETRSKRIFFPTRADFEVRQIVDPINTLERIGSGASQSLPLLKEIYGRVKSFKIKKSIISASATIDPFAAIPLWHHIFSGDVTGMKSEALRKLRVHYDQRVADYLKKNFDITLEPGIQSRTVEAKAKDSGTEEASEKDTYFDYRNLRHPDPDIRRITLESIRVRLNFPVSLRSDHKKELTDMMLITLLDENFAVRNEAYGILEALYNPQQADNLYYVEADERLSETQWPAEIAIYYSQKRRAFMAEGQDRALPEDLSVAQQLMGNMQLRIRISGEGWMNSQSMTQLLSHYSEEAKKDHFRQYISKDFLYRANEDTFDKIFTVFMSYAPADVSPVLEEALDHSDPEIALGAALTFSYMGEQEYAQKAVPFLIARLKEKLKDNADSWKAPRPGLRYINDSDYSDMILALGRIGLANDEITATLDEFLQDSFMRRSFGEEIIIAYADMASQGAAVGPNVFNIYSKWIYNDDFLRKKLHDALRVTRFTEAGPVLLNRFRNFKKGANCRSLVLALIDFGYYEESDVAGMFRALAPSDEKFLDVVAGANSIEAGLRKAVTHRSDEVQKRAYEIIAEAGPGLKSMASFLYDWYADHPELGVKTAEALYGIGETVKAAQVASEVLLQGDTPELRIKAAQFFIELGPDHRETIPSLIIAAHNDPSYYLGGSFGTVRDYWVRIMANNALTIIVMNPDSPQYYLSQAYFNGGIADIIALIHHWPQANKLEKEAILAMLASDQHKDFAKNYIKDKLRSEGQRTRASRTLYLPLLEAIEKAEKDGWDRLKEFWRGDLQRREGETRLAESEDQHKTQLAAGYPEDKQQPLDEGSDGEHRSSPIMQSLEENAAIEDIGGIDFNPAALDLQIKRDGQGVPLPLLQQPVKSMNIEGFQPVIIQISPINIPLFLGMSESPENPSTAASLSPLFPQADVQEKFLPNVQDNLSRLN